MALFQHKKENTNDGYFILKRKGTAESEKMWKPTTKKTVYSMSDFILT